MKLKEKIQAGQTLFTAWSSIPDPLVAGILASSAFDAVTLDMQHGGHSDDSVLRCIGPVIQNGAHPVVRIPVGRFDMASRALDFGAEAVIAPMINTLADARAFADAMKYPPLGGRSWGPSFVMAYQSDPDTNAIAFSRGESINAKNPAMDGILRHLAARAKAAGKFAASFGLDGPHARFLADMGYQLVAVGTDIGCVKSGANALVAGAKG
jgi:4-hydroxy-2-oxoheptanedioate aldolase